MVLLIGEAQQVIHFILYNAVQDHDPGPACELLSLGGWVCGQGDRGAFVDLVIGVNLSVNAPDLDRCRGILGGQGVAGCPLGQVIIVLCLVIRHAVALVLALKVQLVCIACDRELTAFFRVGNLDGGGGGKGIADGDLLVGLEVNIAVVPLKLGALQLCGGVFALTEINAVFAVLDRAVLNDQIAAVHIRVIRPCRFARRNGSIAARAIHSGTIDAQCAAVPYLQCRGLVVNRLMVDILVGVGISTAEKVGGGARHKHIAVGSGDIGICDVQRCIIGGAQRRTLYEYLDVLIAGVRAAADIDPTVDGVQDPARAGGCHIIEGRFGGIHDQKRRAVAIVAVVGAAIDGHIGSLICFNSTLDGFQGEIVKRPVAAEQIACGDVVTLPVIVAAVKHCGAREAVFGIEATAEGEAPLCRRDGLPLSVDGHAIGVADCNKVRTVFFIPILFIKGRFSDDVDDHILVLSVDHDPLCIGTAYGINLAAAMLFNEILVDDVAAGQETGRCRLSGGLCRRIGIFLCAHSAFKFCTSLQSKCAHGKDRGHHAACKYRTDEPCAKLLHKDNSSLVFFVHAGFFRLPARFKHLKYSISAARRNLHSVRTFWIPPPVFSCVL